MAKFVQILCVAFLAIALCSAEAPRARNARFQNRRRFLARQEVEAEPAAVTPYPSADELKPEKPFDEASAAEQPNQPDEVYGPPEDETPVETDNVAATDEEQAAAAEEAEAVAKDEEAAAAAEEEALSRLNARRTAAIRRSSVRAAKLRRAAPARLQVQPQFVRQPVFYYVAQ